MWCCGDVSLLWIVVSSRIVRLVLNLLRSCANHSDVCAFEQIYTWFAKNMLP